MKKRKTKTDSLENDEPEATNSAWPYPTEYGDHFETSEEALRHLEPALYRFTHHLGKAKDNLIVYDPYFCKGSIRAAYEGLGIKNLIHEKRDFYADVRKGSVPDYDILITNPPYSGDHKERIIKYCIDSGKPWALLMPNYVYNKAYFQDQVAKMSTSGGVLDKPFFIVPDIKYEYSHPESTGHESSPFFSIWSVYLGKDTARTFNWWDKLLSKKTGKGSNEAGLRILRNLSDLREADAIPTWKRPNPKQRKKLKMNKEAA